MFGANAKRSMCPSVSASVRPLGLGLSESFGLTGPYAIGLFREGKSEIHQWRLDGRWRLSGKDHPLDLILDTKTNEIT